MSNPANRSFDWIATLARFGVGLLFIYMGWNKVADPAGFLKLVRQYDLPVHYLVLNGIAAVLPWFEIICGVLLTLGLAVRGTAILMLGMLVPFTILVVRRALEIASLKGLALCAVKFDCGCGAGEVYTCAKIVENCVLAALSAWFATGSGKRLAVRYSLLRSPTDGTNTH